MPKTRSFVITNFALDSDEVFERNKTQIRFLAYSIETCPKTDRLHHQCYVYFHNLKSTGIRSIKKIATMFSNSHVEVMRGSFQQNEAYCSKEGALIKLGDEPKQGARGDLDETVKMIIDSDLTYDEIVVTNPSMAHMYGRTLKQAEIIGLRKQYRKEMTTGIWYWGKTGVGKSHRAFEGYSPETHYVKDCATIWWDGYKGQETVIFNEYRSEFTFSYLLQIVDKWPFVVPIRGKESLPFLAKHVIFTSACHPKECYPNITDERFEQLERRVVIRELVRFNP